MEDLINAVYNYGVGIAVIVYFIWKDAKLTANNTTLLGQVKHLLTLLEVKFEMDFTGDGKIGEEDEEI